MAVPRGMECATTNRVGMEPVALSLLWLASMPPNYLARGLLVGFLCRTFKVVSSGLLFF